MSRFSLLALLLWLFPHFRFWVTEPGAGGGADPAPEGAPPNDGKTAAGAGQGGQPGAAAVDVQAEIARALAAERKSFGKALKEATGHESLEKLHEAQAKARGEHEQLLTQRTAELDQARAELARLRVESALMAAASEAVDPTVVIALLSGRASVEGGAVTIDGKSPADAVKALLAEKPFLARAGAAGSGAPSNGGRPPPSTMSRGEFERLDPGSRREFCAKGGRITD